MLYCVVDQERFEKAARYVAHSIARDAIYIELDLLKMSEPVSGVVWNCAKQTEYLSGCSLANSFSQSFGGDTKTDLVAFRSHDEAFDSLVLFALG